MQLIPSVLSKVTYTISWNLASTFLYLGRSTESAKIEDLCNDNNFLFFVLISITARPSPKL